MARILVVDDNVRLARTLASYLEMEGHQVDQAYDGEGALSAAGSRVPDVVVLDINMPSLDGFAVCRTIRTTSPATSVIIVSGRGGEDDARRAAEAGAAVHLTKPISLLELQSSIRRLLAAG